RPGLRLELHVVEDELLEVPAPRLPEGRVGFRMAACDEELRVVPGPPVPVRPHPEPRRQPQDPPARGLQDFPHPVPISAAAARRWRSRAPAGSAAGGAVVSGSLPCRSSPADPSGPPAAAARLPW